MNYSNVKTLTAEHYKDPKVKEQKKSELIIREPAIKKHNETQDYFNTTLNQIDPNEIKKLISDSKLGGRKKTECSS